jgi:OOP family OmpA-OmpF porin
MRAFVRLSSLLIVVTPSLAAADAKFEAGLAIGGHSFDPQGALGASQVMSDPGPVDAGLLGARFGVVFGKRLAAEAEVMLIPTEDDVLGDEADVYATRAHARLDLMTGKLRPFLVAGAGVLSLRSDSPQLLDDDEVELHWGGGLRYLLGNRFDLRFDLRHLVTADRTDDGLGHNYEATASFGIRFGGTPKPAAREVVAKAPPPPPAPKDSDGDKLVDHDDSCPLEAEDRDNFEDRDGCPDADNDRDKFADTVDACRDQAETVNGWQDDDGCPDEVIAEIAGIEFARGSASIDRDSTLALAKAFEILSAHPALRVEISGHTSLEGTPQRNDDLSRSRALAVKQWLITKGIQAERIEAVGFGASKPQAPNDTHEGRKKNRRIEFRVLVPDASS